MSMAAAKRRLKMYSKRLYAGWADMDFNAHMSNTAYLNKCSDVRMLLFAENGFPISELARLKIGPVAMRDELDYFKEVNLMDELTVTAALAGLSDDGSRWAMRHELVRADAKLCARVTSTGGWLDLTARRLVVPPENMLAVVRELSRTDDFRILPSSIKAS
jgi:acyl-CoA thioester hydrolase